VCCALTTHRCRRCPSIYRPRPPVSCAPRRCTWPRSSSATANRCTCSVTSASCALCDSGKDWSGCGPHASTNRMRVQAGNARRRRRRTTVLSDTSQTNVQQHGATVVRRTPHVHRACHGQIIHIVHSFTTTPNCLLGHVCLY
jgi:hypothetical protein